MQRLLRTAITFGALALAAIAVAPTNADACAGLIGSNGAVNLGETTTLAAYHDGIEHYVTAFEFLGGGGQFGTLIPLPGVPTSVERGGAWTLQRVNPDFLEALIPVLLLLMVVYFTVAPKATDEDRHSRLGDGALLGFMGVIGFYDGFFGPGTGSFIITALVALFGLGLVSATAHTKLLNLSSNIAALLTFIIGGKVLWALGLMMAVCSIAGGQVGAHLALRVGGKVIRPLLVAMSLLLCLKLLSDPANPLRAWVMG